MSGDKHIRTAVIDDGISESLYNIGRLDFDIVIDQNLSVYTRKGYNTYLPSHGTTCAAIIQKYAPDVCIGSIKILSDTGKRAIRHQFITAVEWCIKNEIRLLNLSLGTVVFSDFEDIRNFVNKAADNGLILVAACNNKNTYTVPACLTNVIGVKCRRLYFNGQYKFNMYPFDGIDIEASGRHFLTDAYGEKGYTMPANSFASPLVTAMVHKILVKNPHSVLEEIKEVLYRNAMNFQGNSYNPYIYMNADWFDEHFRHVKVDIPVIAVFDTENGNILNKLNLFFFNKGYYSVKISTDYKDIVSGSEYLPESVEIGQFIAMVYKKYSCDVVIVRICNTEKFEYIEKNELFDIILFITEDGDYCNDNDTKSNLPVVLSFSPNEINVRLDDIFLVIFKLLGGTRDSNENEA